MTTTPGGVGLCSERRSSGLTSAGGGKIGGPEVFCPVVDDYRSRNLDSSSSRVRPWSSAPDVIGDVVELAARSLRPIREDRRSAAGGLRARRSSEES